MYIADIKPVDMDDEYHDEYIDKTAIYDDLRDIVDSVTTSDFENLFKDLKTELNKYETNMMVLFCRSLYIEFVNKTSYEIVPQPDFLIDTHRSNFLDFMEFYHYDYIDFFSHLFIELDFTTDDVIKPNFVEDKIQPNGNIIMEAIETISINYSYNWILSQFLRTYDRHNFMNWIVEKIKMDKSLIICEMPELMES